MPNEVRSTWTYFLNMVLFVALFLNFRSTKIIKGAILDNEFMRHLDVHQINEIVDCMSEVKSDKGDIIIKEGEVGFKVYAIEGVHFLKV